MSTELITRLRGLVTDGGLSRSGLARAAGLHANTLRDLDQPDWNPTADTLRKLEAYLFDSDDTPALVPIEEIIEEARNGRMFILVDDEDRENEGDLIIPAQMATPDAINFMATHGRGLICLAMTRSRVDALGLDLMSRSNGTRHETAFTATSRFFCRTSPTLSRRQLAWREGSSVDRLNSPHHSAPCAGGTASERTDSKADLPVCEVPPTICNRPGAKQCVIAPAPLSLIRSVVRLTPSKTSGRPL